MWHLVAKFSYVFSAVDVAHRAEPLPTSMFPVADVLLAVAPDVLPNAVHFAAAPLARVTVAVCPLVSANPVESACLVSAHVAVSSHPQAPAYALLVVTDPLAFVNVAVMPLLRADAFALACDELADVLVAIRVSLYTELRVVRNRLDNCCVHVSDFFFNSNEVGVDLFNWVFQWLVCFDCLLFEAEPHCLSITVAISHAVFAACITRENLILAPVAVVSIPVYVNKAALPTGPAVGPLTIVLGSVWV